MNNGGGLSSDETQTRRGTVALGHASDDDALAAADQPAAVDFHEVDRNQATPGQFSVVINTDDRVGAVSGLAG